MLSATNLPMNTNSTDLYILNSEIIGLAENLPKFNGRDPGHCTIWIDYLDHIYLALSPFPAEVRLYKIKNICLQRSEDMVHRYVFDKLNSERKTEKNISWADF